MTGGPASKEDVLRALVEEGEKRKGGQHALLGAGTALVAVLLFTVFLSLMKDGGFPTESFVSIIGGLAAVLSAVALTSRHAEAVKAAEQWADPAMTPWLIDVLDTDSSEVKAAARRALAASLPLVKEEHASLFDLSHIGALTGLLKDKEPGLAAAAAAALGRIGSAGCVGPLEQLADGRMGHRGPAKERLSTAARMALASLRMRLAGGDARRPDAASHGPDEARENVSLVQG